MVVASYLNHIRLPQGLIGKGRQTFQVFKNKHIFIYLPIIGFSINTFLHYTAEFNSSARLKAPIDGSIAIDKSDVCRKN